MKRVVIVYSHLYEKRFNHAVLEKIQNDLQKRQASYEVLDLYQAGFDLTYSKQELALFYQGKTSNPLATPIST